MEDRRVGEYAHTTRGRVRGEVGEWDGEEKERVSRVRESEDGC